MEQIEGLSTPGASTVLDWLRELPGQPEALLYVTFVFGLSLIFFWTKLRRARSSFQEREAALRQQLADYEKGLKHLAEGVCLYNANDELIFANQPFLALYGLPAECAAPGTAFDQIIRRAAELGHFQGRSLEHVLWERLTFVARREPGFVIQKRADGRTIAINHTQAEGGGWLATYLDITRLCRAEEQSAFLLRYDPLTRLPNRVYFREILQRTLPEMSSRQRTGIFYISIARLNLVSGLFGRNIAELLLQQISQRLGRYKEQGDFLARLSEDAFGFLRPEPPHAPSAEEFAQRLIIALTQAFNVNGHQIHISANIGIAMAPSDSAQPDALLMFAEQTMRYAQRQGPGQKCLFRPEMAQREHAQLRVEHELRRALEQEEFEVFYQPIVDLRTRRIASFEALVRWRHPVDGILLPGVFIPIAESSGLMAALGRLVLRRACRDAATWPPEIRVAVNMSATQLGSRSAIEMVKSAMLESWLPPKRLDIELTESHFLDKRADGLVVLQALRDLGIRVALDDFGTGYASLSSLLEFRFDKIKIDRSFIESLLEKPEHMEIVRSIIRLAGSLGISVVAEGVEAADQLAWLKTEGCAEVQSFLLGSPMPASAVLDVLQKQEALEALVA